MGKFEVTAEKALVPVYANMFTGQPANPEEADDNSQLVLDEQGRPTVTFHGVDRGTILYTDAGDDVEEDAVYVKAAAAVKRLERRGYVVAVEEEETADESEPTAPKVDEKQPNTTRKKGSDKE